MDSFSLLRKLLVELPVWLLAKLSFRKIVFLAGLLLLIFAFAQAFPLDVAFLFAGDAMTYFDIFAAVMLLAARGQLQLLLRSTLQRGRGLLTRIAFFRRVRSRARRLRGTDSPSGKKDAGEIDGPLPAFA